MFGERMPQAVIEIKGVWSEELHKSAGSAQPAIPTILSVGWTILSGRWSILSGRWSILSGREIHCLNN